MRNWIKTAIWTAIWSVIAIGAIGSIAMADEPKPSALTGLYVGGQGAWTHTDDARGTAVGIHAGYAARYSSFIVGIEADYSITGIQNDAGTITAAIDQDWVAAIRGNLGVEFQPGLMIYLTAGPAWSKIMGSTEQLWQAGAGLRWALTDTLSVTGSVIQMFDSDSFGDGQTIARLGVSVRVW